MKQHTFKPGDKVRDTETGETYTVVTGEDEYGYVAFTRDVPQVEHIRPQFIEPADAPAFELLQAHPELLTGNTTLNALDQLGQEHGVDSFALLRAFGQLMNYPRTIQAVGHDA